MCQGSFLHSGSPTMNKTNVIVYSELTCYYVYEYVCVGGRDKKTKIKK